MPKKKTKKPVRLISDEAAAGRLGVSKTTVRRMRRDDELPTVYVRGAARIPERAVDEYIASNVGGIAKAGA
ncbi:helix-turn-helix domain-containing protein [Kribbella sp. DT2]|uniref:helix-turn-helix domain-containing protein n=1 Tax=Kribbella sp. DT2 TaxID=3393427 RepID=UPI003CE8085A